MEWEILMTTQVEGFLDGLYEADPVSHRLVNQAILVLERNGPAEGRPLVVRVEARVRAAGATGAAEGLSLPTGSGRRSDACRRRRLTSSRNRSMSLAGRRGVAVGRSPPGSGRGRFMRARSFSAP